MCGIGGFVERGNARAADALMLGDMLRLIRHRGPDDEGMYVDGPLALGSRRLSIIDVAGGNQPITNEDGSGVLVFNGEIYNYPQLPARLLRPGHMLATESDTEVIVHLYEELGDACVAELRGMYGFALWDERRQRLLIVRDRLGIKPIYYADTPDAFVFGSEIKSLLRHPAVEARLDPAGLSNFLSLRYVPAPQTMFAGIHALPPGHLVVFEDGRATVRRYWDLSFANREPCRTEEECADQLDVLLRECVRMHLVSDVPFGAFLSGGLDSSTVVALMTLFLDEPVKTFAVGYEGPDAAHSELPYARMVARWCRTDHHEVILTARD